MNNSTLLLRQINPSWIQHDRVTSQAFRPTPKDKKMLSAYDGDQITAENSWKHFTNDLGLGSVGVQALSVDELIPHGLKVIPDPKTFKEHCLIDFSPFTDNEAKSKSKELKKTASRRDWLFQE